MQDIFSSDIIILVFNIFIINIFKNTKELKEVLLFYTHNLGLTIINTLPYLLYLSIFYLPST